MTPHPPELWEQARLEYIAGKPIAEIAKLTGLAHGSITGKAKLSGWTVAKQERKQKEQLSGLRPLLHSKLLDTAKQIKVPKTGNSKRLKPILDCLATATSTAKELEGWQPNATTLVDIKVLSQTSYNPHHPPAVPPVTDGTVQVLDVPQDKACLSDQVDPELEG